MYDSTLEMILKNERSEIDRAAKVINAHGAASGWPEEWMYRINVSVDELITNTVNYSYTDSGHHLIRLKLIATPDKLTVTIEDDGVPFNPFEEAPPPDDVDTPLEDRRIGGLGVFFVKTFMDEVAYERTDDGLNIITLVQLRESQNQGDTEKSAP